MKRFKGQLVPYAVAVFPLFFPLYFYKMTFLGVPFTLPEIGLGFLALLFIFREGIWKISWWKKYAYHWRILSVLLFIIAAIVSTFITPELSYFPDGQEFAGRMIALGILKGWILAPLVYFFMARHYFREKPSLISLALRSMLAGGVILSIMALQQVWTGDYLTPDSRASGPFDSANYLALYLGPLLVYSALAWMDKKQEMLERIALFFVAVLCTVALYFTKSYAAFIAVLAGLSLASFVLIPKKYNRHKYGLLAGVFILGILIVLSQLGSDKFSQFLNFDGRSSSSVRIQVYEISLNLIKQYPLQGIGLGQFEQVYQSNAIDILGHDPFEWVMIHPHNIFLAMWLNLGLLGLVAFVWMLIKAFAWLFETDKHERRLAAIMLSTIIVHGLFDTPYFKNDLAFQFWLLFAILL